MTSLLTDRNKYAGPTAYPLVDAVHSMIRDVVRRRWAESGVDWGSFVFGSSHERITETDLVGVEQAVLDTGYRFAWSASISQAERPEIYVGGEGGSDWFDHAEAQLGDVLEDGFQVCGAGDNVVRRSAIAEGTALYVRSTQQVLSLLTGGVPEGSIAIIDDSGGTLTAPILEQFAGVVCAGGTTRSHLGILTREYGIPCLMNAKVTGIRNGDRVRLESTARARTAEDYQTGTEVTATVWRLSQSKEQA
jgi:hypothetical protein